MIVTSLVLFLFILAIAVDSSNVQKESIPTSWHGGRWRPGRPLKRSTLLGSEDTPANHRWWPLASEAADLGPGAEERLQRLLPRAMELDSEPMFLADGFGMAPEIDGNVLSPLEEKTIFLLLNNADQDQIPPPETPIITPIPGSRKPTTPSQSEAKRVSKIPSTADQALSTASRLSF